MPSDPRPYLIAGGAWRDDSGLHVAWYAQKPGYRYHLLLNTYDPLTGDELTAREFDVFPSQAVEDDMYFAAATGGPGGTFVVVGAWWTSTWSSPILAFVGSLASDVVKTVELNPEHNASAAWASASTVAWDGEAFRIHAYGGDPPPTGGVGLHVLRLALDGTVILPFQPFGSTPSPGYGILGYKTATDPTTGRSFVFDAVSKNFLNGHDREGERLAGTENGPKMIEGNGVPLTGSGLPAISAARGDAWSSWTQSDTGLEGYLLVVQRLDADGDPFGPARTPPRTWDSVGGSEIHALLARGNGKLAIVSHSSLGTYVIDADAEGNYGEPRLLIDSSELQDPWMQLHHAETFTYEDEEWLYYAEARVGPPVIRVVNLAPGCVYRSATLPE